jgi:hypothetical protein
MNPNFPGMGGIDPSKMSPQAIAEMTQLMQTLSHAQIMQMQTLMHNAMGGFNVNQEMEEFEKSLPSSFREKMARIMYMSQGIEVPAQAPAIQASAMSMDAPTNMDEARLVILQSVANGLMEPAAALKVLFPN